MNSEILESIMAFKNGSWLVYWAVVPGKSGNYQNWPMKLGVRS